MTGLESSWQKAIRVYAYLLRVHAGYEGAWLVNFFFIHHSLFAHFPSSFYYSTILLFEKCSRLTLTNKMIKYQVNFKVTGHYI